MDAKAAPNQGSGGGGGVGKKKRRKRGGGAGPQTSVHSIPKDAGGRGGGKGGNKHKRRGGGGGGRGGGGGDFSRFGPNASSPLQLPHCKVTLRNIRDANKYGSIEGLVNSIREFLEGAFPSVAAAEDSEASPYMISWKMEKEEFESAKSMFAEAAVSGGSGGVASSSGRAFSSGWLYEEKPSPLPSGRWGRLSLLPGAEDIVEKLMENNTDKKVTKSSNVNFIVDAAMSQMMQECGKKYLNFVGGQIVFDEVSAMDLVLAEKVQSEKKKLAEEKMAEEKLAEEKMAEVITEEEDMSPDQPTTEKVTSEKKDETISVEAVTKGIEKLSASDKASAKQKVSNQMPVIQVRILSATRVKNSKRRGEIAGKVQLALYPPDPCFLFQDTCREAGKMAAEKHLNNNAKAVSASVVEEKPEKIGKKEVEEDKPANAKHANPNPHPPAKKATVPQIPYYPLLSPAERSRAVARSRVLLRRSIEAMKAHAAAQCTKSLGKGVHQWEVLESSSQKTWKGRPNPMIESMMAGTPLRDLVAEHKSAKSAGGCGGGGGGGGGAAAKKGRKGGFYGDSRADRYDSTIENTEDYKAFMESLKDGSNPSNESANKDTATDASKNGDSKSFDTDRSPPVVDEEGRPLSAIVMHLREKQAESAKARAEVAAAQARARAAAAAAKEKVRKDKLKTKKDKSKKRKKEVARSTKSSSRAPSSRPVIKSKPPPKASVPVSGFEVR